MTPKLELAIAAADRQELERFALACLREADATMAANLTALHALVALLHRIAEGNPPSAASAADQRALWATYLFKLEDARAALPGRTQELLRG